MDYKTFNKGCLEEAKRLYKTANADQRYVLEKLFPELRETEDEKIRKNLINFLDAVWHLGKNANFDEYSKADCAEWISWLEKQTEQKSAWSEDDERMLHTIIADFKGFIRDNTSTLESHFNECIDWLKSIKSRISLKQEWSEEEIEKAAQEWESKAILNPFYMTMEGGKPTGVKQSITTHKESFKAGINWILKFLRPQNRYD